MIALLLVLNVLAWVAAAVVAVPMLTVVIETVAAFRRRRLIATADPENGRPRVGVIVPAHNEESGIRRTLETVMPQLRENDRCVVVADNCDDATAAIARAGGAEVVERFHATDRGKGFALAAGMDALRADAPAVVIIIDADCCPEPGTLDTLSAACVATHAAVQAADILSVSENVSQTGRLSAFAFIVKNVVRQRGMAVLGQPALLQGTGMAFPWMTIDACDLATGSIVEDLVMGLDLVERGSPVRFCDRACVVSGQGEGAALQTQRTRWEHGYLSTMLARVPRLLVRGLAGRPDLFMLGLDLAVPPLALLTFAYVGVTGFAVAAALAASLLGGWTGLGGLLLWGPVLPLLTLGLLFAGAIFAASARFGRGVISPKMLLLAPVYAMSKVPIYLGFVTKRETTWVRTQRENEVAAE